MTSDSTDVISVEELKERLDQGDELFILDCREPREYEISRVPESTLIPMGELRDRVDDLEKEREIVVVCRTGKRSAMVTHFLRNQGFEAKNLVGGVNEWADKIDPSQTKY